MEERHVSKASQSAACEHLCTVPDEAGAHLKCCDCGDVFYDPGWYDAWVASQGGVVDGPPIEGEGGLL